MRRDQSGWSRRRGSRSDGVRNSDPGNVNECRSFIRALFMSKSKECNVLMLWIAASEVGEKIKFDF